MTRDEEIFGQALELPLAQRPAFLLKTCSDDEACRGRVEALLSAHERAAGFLNVPLAPGVFAEPEVTPENIGRYKLREKIGEGGCGVVYLAEQEEPIRRPVALKVIKLGMDTHAVIARFEAERQALALMDHPNIAKVFDAGATEGGRPYFVMEWVRGTAITHYCDSHRIGPLQRLELFIAVCSAVHHAHQKGIIHRDLKPSNILVAIQDEVPVPKVIDFGVAKATMGPLTDHTLHTSVEQFIGTPAYMSPEQANRGDSELDAGSDIYSLGVLLYELLVGRPPFDVASLAKSSVDEIRRQIRDVEPPTPSGRWRAMPEASRATAAACRSTTPHELAGALKGDLGWIVMRCLEKDRARRYATAQDLARDIQRHLRHEAVLARPPSRAYRLGKWVRRHRTAVITAAVVAALGLIGLQEARRADQAEKQASEREVVILKERASVPMPVPAPDPKSLAVLPFANLSREEDNAFFADGMHEDVLTSLAHIRDLKVTSNTSVAEYKGTAKGSREIGRELGVAYLLEGSVQRSEKRVRVTADLIDARTDTHVWAKSYDRDLSDLFLIQAELAETIAAELQATLTSQEKIYLNRRPTENIAAYDLFLRVRERKANDMMSPGNQQEISMLEEALKLDPKFAVAWAELAMLRAMKYQFVESSQPNRDEAKAALDKVTSLAPGTPEALYGLANYSYRVMGDLPAAEGQFKQLLELTPDDAWALTGLGVVQQRRREWKEATASLRRACALEPKNLSWLINLFMQLCESRRYEDAAEVLRSFTRSSSKWPDSQQVEFQTAVLRFFATGSKYDAEEWLRRNETKGDGPQPSIPRQEWDYLLGGSGDYAGGKSFSELPRWGGLVYYSILPQRLRKLVAGLDPRSRPAPVTGIAKLLVDSSMRAIMRLQTQTPRRWNEMAAIDVLMGNYHEALHYSDRAQELLGNHADEIDASFQLATRAFVYAWSGDHHRAVAELGVALRTHASGVVLNVHVMGHSPDWKPLWGDPEFEALLNDPACSAPLF